MLFRFSLQVRRECTCLTTFLLFRVWRIDPRLMGRFWDGVSLTVLLQQALQMVYTFAELIRYSF